MRTYKTEKNGKVLDLSVSAQEFLDIGIDVTDEEFDQILDLPVGGSLVLPPGEEHDTKEMRKEHSVAPIIVTRLT